MLELFDILQKAFNLIAALADVIVELVVHLLAPFDLRLEVFHCAVNVAQGPLLRVVLGFLVFEMCFQLLHDMLILRALPADGEGRLPL